MYTEGIAIVTVVLFGVVLIAGVIAWGFAWVYQFQGDC